MAEFQEVLQQWKRMCDAVGQDCDRCPIEGSPCQYIHFGILDLKFNERKIMQWATEHPEPVYPNWIDWLMSESVIPTNYMADNSTDSGVRAGMFYVTSKAFEPIPADIAQKLGIEPKEAR